MATTSTTEKNVEYAAFKRNTYLNWYENSPKLMFGEHKLLFELYGEDEEFFIQKAQEELRETSEIVDLGLKEFGQLVAADPNFCVPQKDICIAFLRRCKWYANSAFSLMKQYYKFRQIYPHIYTDLLPSKETIGLYSGIMYPLPLRNKDGSRLLFIEVRKWKPKEVPLENLFKSFIFLLYLATGEPKTQIAGVHVIIDLDGMSLSQVTYLTPSFAKMLVDFIQKCLPARLKGIHIIKQSFIFNIAFAIFKPFLEEKFRKRIITHGTNWESLIKSTATDKSMLITKYGGTLKEPDEPVGTTLWQNIVFLEPIIEVDLKNGYTQIS